MTMTELYKPFTVMHVI